MPCWSNQSAFSAAGSISMLPCPPTIMHMPNAVFNTILAWSNLVVSLMMD